MVAAINWDVDSQLIEGYNTPNLYGLLFVTGLIIGYFVVRKMFRKDGISDEMLDKLVLFMVVATIVGARLGHVFFYGPYWDEVSADGVVLERGYFSSWRYSEGLGRWIGQSWCRHRHPCIPLHLFPTRYS